MAKVITAGAVNLIHPESGDLVTLIAGDRVPDWADSIITNPSLVGDAPNDTTQVSGDATDDTGAGDGAASGAQSEQAAVDGTVTELRQRAKELGVAQGGSKADLIERITAKLAADAAATTPDAAGIDPDGPVDAPADTSAPHAPGDTDRAALVARAEALGITVDPEWSDTELEALIEDAED